MYKNDTANSCTVNSYTFMSTCTSYNSNLYLRQGTRWKTSDDEAPTLKTSLPSALLHPGTSSAYSLTLATVHEPLNHQLQKKNHLIVFLTRPCHIVERQSCCGLVFLGRKCFLLHKTCLYNALQIFHFDRYVFPSGMNPRFLGSWCSKYV
ncbi:hypothetical protein BaRGS_00026423 [Batillaria attramentaria]|uniref:Uncharacterized protein n=1 Tax=Batillaria attramentaria TaxID=370345 RepID=A0ABD0K645_9CAEN